MSAKTYTNPYTLDGRLKYAPWVNETKVKYTETLVNKMQSGDREAKGLFEALITTSELSLNLAHLVNAAVLPQIDDLELVSDKIAGSRTVGDFRDNYLYTPNVSFAAGTVGKGGKAGRTEAPLDHFPVVPEGTPYPETNFAGELIEGSNIKKRGVGIGITWEALVNDSTGIVAAIPGLFTTLATNTFEHDVFSKLTGASVGTGAGQIVGLAGGTAVDGTTSVANAPLSRTALANAITQLKKSIRDAYGERVNGGFNLVVAVGQGELANYLINSLSVKEIADGNLTLSVNGYNPLGGVEVIESVYVSGTEWYLLPKKGTTVRPVIDRLKLAGHEQIDLRVENLAGQYLGGGQVGPYEGSFEADTGRWRARIVTDATIWSPKAILKSTGVVTP